MMVQVFYIRLREKDSQDWRVMFDPQTGIPYCTCIEETANAACKRKQERWPETVYQVCNDWLDINNANKSED